METNKLKTFVDLAHTLSFSKTAINLYTTQSSVSKQIKSLEKELGQALFERNNKYVELSEFGRTIVNEATRLVELSDEIVIRADKYDQQSKHQINLGVIPSFYNNDVFQKILDYQTVHPSINITLHEEETSDLFSLLNEGKIDMAYTRSLSDPAKLSYDSLLVEREQFRVCLASNHPLAKAKSITLQQLKNERFIMLSPSSLLYQPVIDLCHQAGFDPNISFVSERMSSIFQMVKDQQGVAIIMQPKQSRSGVVLRSITPTKSSYLFFTKKKQNQSQAIQDLWTYLQQFAIPKRNN